MRALIPFLLALTACQRNVTTEFPEGLEPLEDLVVEAPEGTGEDPYPEVTASAVGEEEDYLWAQVRGYLHADIDDVWALMKNDGVAMADRRDCDAVETIYGGEPEYDLTYINHITVNDIITLEWDLTFRGDRAGGTFQDPDRYAIRFQKTEGSSLIDLQEGSIVIVAIDEGTTEFQFIERLKAPQTSTDDPLSYGEDMHETLKVMLAGGPMPDWDQ